jgi:hypothetical protein
VPITPDLNGLLYADGIHDTCTAPSAGGHARAAIHLPEAMTTDLHQPTLRR